MYKNILYIVIVALLGINIYAYGADIEYNSYKGILYGFIIDYPSQWIVEESPYTFSYIKVSFTEPKSEDYRAFVLAGVEELERDIALDEYEELILVQQRRSLQNFTLIESREDILANNTSKVLIYKGIDIDVPIKGKIAYTISNNTAYTIITTSREDMFDEYDTIFEHIIDSFRIDKSIIPKPISDLYEDEDIKIKFDGWKGLITKIDNDTIIRVTPDIKSNTLMNIIISNITSIDIFDEQIRSLLDNNCTLITLNLIDVNRSNGLEAMQECDNTINKLYLFTTGEKVIAAELIANKESSVYVESFDEIIKSIDANLEDITVYVDELKTLPKRLDAIDIDIPEGWNIFKREYNDHEIIYITPNGSNIISNYIGFFMVKPPLNFNDITEAYNIKCNDIMTIHYITSKHIIEERALCDKGDAKVRLQVVNLDNITIGYFNEYNDKLGIILNNFVDKLMLFALSNAYPEDLIDEEYKVVLDNEDNIEYSYINSTINNIEFDEDSKALSIELSTDSLGMLVIRESLLEGPYTVSIDEQVLNIEDADTIAIVYDDDRSIKIIGSRVIPEFPLVWLMIPLAFSIAIIIKYRYNVSINSNRGSSL